MTRSLLPLALIVALLVPVIAHGKEDENKAKVDDAIKEAADYPGPVILDFRVVAEGNVWPMVPAGVSNDAIQVAKDTAPQWDREEDEATEQPEDADKDGI